MLKVGNNDGSPCELMEVEEKETINLPTRTRVGYTGKWVSANESYDFGSTYVVTGDQTFKVEWIPNTYTITFNRNGGTTGTTSMLVQYEGSMGSIIAPTRSGYRFEYYEDSNHDKYYINGQNEENIYSRLGDLTLTAVWTESYLEIENIGKSGLNWRIKITNNSSTTIEVKYNKKMCYHSDAKNWTGLTDINGANEEVSIDPGKSEIVIISENWFATSITVSYVDSEGVRRITYANELNVNGSMNVGYNKI